MYLKVTVAPPREPQGPEGATRILQACLVACGHAPSREMAWHKGPTHTHTPPPLPPCASTPGKLPFSEPCPVPFKILPLVQSPLPAETGNFGAEQQGYNSEQFAHAVEIVFLGPRAKKKLPLFPRPGGGGRLRGSQDANFPPPPLGASGQQLVAKGAASGVHGRQRRPTPHEHLPDPAPKPLATPPPHRPPRTPPPMPPPPPPPPPRASGQRLVGGGGGGSRWGRGDHGFL